MQVVDGAYMPSRAIGELIGEMAMFSGGKRTSDVVAMSAGHIAVFQFAHLQQLKQTHAELAEKVMTRDPTLSLGLSLSPP